MAANNERKDPPDLLSGSLEFARSSMTSSMRFLGETVGYIDSDDEDETEAGNEEENKLTGTPEDTLKLPEAAKHRRALLAKKKILKEERKGKTAAGAAAGAVIGAIVVFPVFPLGLVLGGALFLMSCVLSSLLFFLILLIVFIFHVPSINSFSLGKLNSYRCCWCDHYK
uniref:Uncharacterized protein n=1 Tax=Ditylum brightwellii TaxID=49249 RepID=A0A7S4RR29_9STRA